MNCDVWPSTPTDEKNFSGQLITSCDPSLSKLFGYWLFSKSKKKSSLFFGLLGERRKKGVSIVLLIGGSLSVQVIWLIGYSVKIKRKKFSHFFGLPGETIHKYLVKGLDDM